MTISATGIPTSEQIEKILPDRKRREEQAYAVIECFQEIPCDPCTKICPKNAILPMENINNIPQIDYSLCDGCGLCITICPGVAIFVVDETYSEKNALVKIPHEFIPPEKGTVVSGLDRSGKAVCDARVVRVVPSKSKTTTLWLEVPKELANQVRAIEPLLIKER